MEILNHIEIVGKALWIRKYATLIIADLHIGYEEMLNEKGILVPRTQFKEMKKELEILLEQTRPRRIIINGDLKHEFGKISHQEWHETNEILDLLLSYAKVILVKGNHDTILQPIAEKRGLEIMQFYHVKEICILHGDKIISNLETNKAKILIIGHEHPAISLTEEFKKEKYKCFLLGKWKEQKLIVMPSFFSITEGTDINNEKLLSPYLHQDIDNFDVFIIGDQVYKFGKLKKLRSF